MPALLLPAPAAAEGGAGPPPPPPNGFPTTGGLPLLPNGLPADASPAPPAPDAAANFARIMAAAAEAGGATGVPVKWCGAAPLSCIPGELFSSKESPAVYGVPAEPDCEADEEFVLLLLPVREPARPRRPAAPDAAGATPLPLAAAVLYCCCCCWTDCVTEDEDNALKWGFKPPRDAVPGAGTAAARADGEAAAEYMP